MIATITKPILTRGLEIMPTDPIDDPKVRYGDHNTTDPPYDPNKDDQNTTDPDPGSGDHNTTDPADDPKDAGYGDP